MPCFFIDSDMLTLYVYCRCSLFTSSSQRRVSTSTSFICLGRNSSCFLIAAICSFSFSILLSNCLDSNSVFWNKLSISPEYCSSLTVLRPFVTREDIFRLPILTAANLYACACAIIVISLPTFYLMLGVKMSYQRDIPLWISEDEWRLVYAWLYSDDVDTAKRGCSRVQAWKARSMLPAIPFPIENTAELVQCRVSEATTTNSEPFLQQAYAMGITR